MTAYVEEEAPSTQMPVDAYGKRTKGKFKIPMVSRFKKPTKKDFKSSSAPTSGKLGLGLGLCFLIMDIFNPLCPFNWLKQAITCMLKGFG